MSALGRHQSALALADPVRVPGFLTGVFGGTLLAGGMTPPSGVPHEWWSLLANVIGHLLVAAFFLIEYAYRRHRFPRQPYRNMLDFLLRVLAIMPRLVGNAARH